MPPESSATAVLVRVAPRLLSDVLCAVLRAAGLQVEASPDVERRATPRAPRRFDLAILTDGPPEDVECECIIVLDDQGSVLGEDGAPAGPPGLDRLLVEVHAALDASGHTRRCSRAPRRSPAAP
jgi:hypothetical protein